MSDSLLLIVFGTISSVCFVIGSIAIYLALKNAKREDSELMMAFWSVVALAGFTFAGMSLAYFIIPILSNRYF
ncbi:MAG: hypothetical protein JXA06_09085 [Bacteroidetes bacterium]|nr:hypothetical protein [Bacteroidota bacterium]